MEWIVFALMAPAFWALNGVTAKILIDKKFDKPVPFGIFLCLIDLLYISAIYLIFPISSMFPYILYAMLIAVLNFSSYMCYLSALKCEEASRVSSLAQMTPIFVAILSAIFLSEVLQPRQYVGIILIILASVIVSSKKIEGKRSMSKAFKFMIASSIIWASYNITTKYVLGFIDSWSFIFWNILGTLLISSSTLLIPRVRKDFKSMIKSLNKKVILGGMLKEAFFFSGFGAYLIAISSGYVSLASAINSIQPFLVFVYTLALSLFIPRLLKEEINKYNIMQKLFAIALIFMGFLMLNVF